MEVGPGQCGKVYSGCLALNNVGDACLLSPSGVATAAGVEIEIAAAYLDRMSLSFDQDEEDWFALAEAARWRPYVKVTDDAYPSPSQVPTSGRCAAHSRAS